MPLAMKIRYGMTMLGLSPEEKSATDELVAKIGQNPLVAVLLEEEVSTTEGAIASIARRATDKTRDIGTVLNLAKNPAFRKGLGLSVERWILSHPRKDVLIQVMEKISNLPIPLFMETNYTGIAPFVSDALVPTLLELFPPEEPTAYGMSIECPMCDETFLYHVDTEE
jgi:hypothetical protein